MIVRPFAEIRRINVNIALRELWKVVWEDMGGESSPAFHIQWNCQKQRFQVRSVTHLKQKVGLCFSDYYFSLQTPKMYYGFSAHAKAGNYLTLDANLRYGDAFYQADGHQEQWLMTFEKEQEVVQIVRELVRVVKNESNKPRG
jgi:hypothetical protein